MALKAMLENLDGVDAAIAALYEKVGNQYILSIDDGGFKDKISEFRNNNIDLSNKLKGQDDLQAKLALFGDIDPEKAKAALQQMQDLQEKKLLDAGQLEEVLAQRTERMRSDYDGKVIALQKALDTSQEKTKSFSGQLSKVVIDNALQTAVLGAATVKQGAMQDVLARGRTTWSLDDDGKPLPKGSDGTVMYGTDGKTQLTMDEWAQGLTTSATYLFEPSSGGGGQGNDERQSGGKVIDAGDHDRINASLLDIATGKVQVN